MVKNKKAIGAVVATALLLVVVVFAVVGFQTWYNSYSTSLLVKTEKESEINTILKIEAILDNTLYIKSGSDKIFNEFKIKDKLGNLKCNIKADTESSIPYDTKLLFNFNSGTAIDLSGYNNDGLINGVNCFSEGINGNGCLFDGVDDYINLTGTSLATQNYTDFTVSAWYKSATQDVTDDQYILMYYKSSDKDTIYFGPTDDGFDFSGRARFHMRNSLGTTTRIVYSQTDIVDETWHHLVGIREGSTMKLYIDGVLENSSSTFTDPLIYSNTVRIALGGEYKYDTDMVSGTIDEFAFYSKALTDSEVKQLFMSQKAIFYEQLIFEGTKGINIENCNLENGEAYEIFGITNNQKVEQTMIKK